MELIFFFNIIMENIKSIEIIQNFGRKILLKFFQKKLKSSPLFIIETKSFAQLRKIQRNSVVKSAIDNLIKLLSLNNNDLKIIEMGIMIAWHPTNLFGDDKSKWHPQDEMMFKHSEILLVNLVNENEPKKLKSFLYQFINIFKKWKEGDKQRTIEGIVISYHHRAKHIEKIKNENIDEEQKLIMIKTLNEQLNSLITSLKMIDPNFPVLILKEKHEKMFNMYKKSWEKQFNNIRNIVLDSFTTHLLESINKGEYSIIRNELVGISERLLVLCPKKIYKSISSKLNREKIDKLFQNNNVLDSGEILEILLLLIDTVIIFDSVDNDIDNNKWKIELLEKLSNLKKYLPEILISINQHIDNIIKQIKYLSSNT